MIMKHLKSTPATDKSWQGVVYKMQDAEENTKKLTSLAERINTILKEHSGKLSTQKKDSNKVSK